MKQNLLFNQASALGKRLAMVLTMLLIVGIGQAWGADVVYKTAKFGSSYNSTKVSSYTSSWYSTYDGFRVDIVNANNNNNGWSYIKMGSKNAASTGTITTNAKIDAAITKVSLKIDAITSSNITSITLKTATSSNGTYTSVGTFSKATGTQTITLTSPTANLFYKIEVVCTKGSSNGLIQISQVDYYKADAVSCTTAPIVSAASNSNITSTTATVFCSGGITSLGSAGCSITSYGFVYGTSSNPTISNTKVQVGTTYKTTSDAFSKELTGLTANTTYYVRPYATNGYGTAYGTQTSFKTLELPKYTVNWYVNGSKAYSQTDVAGTALTNIPNLEDYECEDKVFVGWTTQSSYEHATNAPTDLITNTTGLTMPENGANYYAVFAKKETTPESNISTPYKFEITSNNFNTTSYAANNKEKTTTAKATDGSNATLDVKWTSYQVMKGTGDNSGAMQWQKNAGYIYNSTNLGTINSVTVTSTAGTFTTYYGTTSQPSSGNSGNGKGYFKTSIGGATGYASKIVIAFTLTTSTDATTEISEYTTQCTTETAICAYHNIR